MRLEIALSFSAAIFAYLSWKRAAMGGTYEREEALRNRFKGSVNSTNHYRYQLGSVQISEFGGWGYKIWKYLPIFGGVKGQTIVYLYFASPDGQHPAKLPQETKITSHSDFEQLPISEISWKEPTEIIPEGDTNLELKFNSVSPDIIQKSIYDLSGILIELNQ